MGRPPYIDFRKISLDVNGLQFDGIELGPTSGELVLFLHGFPQFADAWLRVMRPMAAAGFHTVAINQRGYSHAARPAGVESYQTSHLISDIWGFAGQLEAPRFHLVGHDWGGFLAWIAAAESPERIRTLSVISTPHVDAFLEAAHNDPDQMDRSKYIQFFRSPGAVPESYFLANDAEHLRGVYQSKVSLEEIEANVRRLSEDSALTAALNWYRAMDLTRRIGKVTVPTLYVWGDQDLALGEVAALSTADYVDAPYVFERLAYKSHWLLEESTAELAGLIHAHIARHSQPNPRQADVNVSV